MSDTAWPPALARLAEDLGRYWWVLVLRGVFAGAFAAMAFVWPGITLAVLVLMFGVWLLVDGIFSAVHALRSDRRRQHLLYAAVSIAAGLGTLFFPGVSTLALLYVIAFWAIFKGVVEVWLAIRLRREIEGEWLLGLAGLLSILFGVLLLMLPVTGALAVVWIIGVYALVFGVCLVVLGMRLRSHHPVG